MEAKKPVCVNVDLWLASALHWMEGTVLDARQLLEEAIEARIKAA
jgi:hypothetical protein